MSKHEIILSVYLQPGAKKTEVSGMHDGHIKIKVNSQPVEGKANEALLLFLSKLLKIPKSDIKIISGQKTRIKKISIFTFLDENDLKNKILKN